MMTKMKFKVIVNGKEYVVEVEEISGAPVVTSVTRVPQVKTIEERPAKVEEVRPKPEEKPQEEVKTIVTEKREEVTEGEIVRAPLPGKITRIIANEGQQVNSGDVVLYIEAMKMENEVVAPKSGKITKIFVKEGTSVNTDDPLFAIA